MKKLKKILLVIFIIVVVLGISVMVLGCIFLDKIVKTGIVTVAPTITKTTVTLDTVHISLMSGGVSLSGFVIGNPDGYKTTNAISVGKAAVVVVPNTIMADKIIVHSIDVQAPEVTFEGNPFGDNNLKKLMDNVNSGAATAKQNATPSSPAQPSQGASKKLEVDDFSITGIKIHAVLSGVSSLPGMEGKDFTVPIPDIHFTQLGTGPDGITAAELTKKVVQQIVDEAGPAVANYAKTLVGGAASGLLNGTGKSTDSIKKGLGGLLQK